MYLNIKDKKLKLLEIILKNTFMPFGQGKIPVKGKINCIMQETEKISMTEIRTISQTQNSFSEINKKTKRYPKRK